MPVHSASPEFPGWAKNRYDAALRSVDAAFGRLVDGLDREGRLSRTAILFTSDHGEALCDRFVEGACSLRRTRDSVSLRGGAARAVRGPRALDAEGARRGSRQRV
jgi:arylsulfatase A-like enzyme